MDSPSPQSSRFSLVPPKSPLRDAPKPLPTVLQTKPFSTRNARRDLSTSFKCLQVAYGLLDGASVLHEQAVRLGDRAAEVLGGCSAALAKAEGLAAEADRTKSKVYEYSGESVAADTVFRIQSLMMDIQAFSTDFASTCTKDRLRLLVQQLPSHTAAIATLTRSLVVALNLYSLPISTSSWASEDEADRQADLAALPRLFRVSIALRGPLYEQFLLELPSAPDAGKRRQEFINWCLDKNLSLRPKEGTEPVRAWTLPTPPTSPAGPLPPLPQAGRHASVVLVPYKYGPSRTRPESVSYSARSSIVVPSPPTMSRSASNPIFPSFREDPSETYSPTVPYFNSPTTSHGSFPSEFGKTNHDDASDEELVPRGVPVSPTSSRMSNSSSEGSQLFLPVLSIEPESTIDEHLVEEEATTTDANVQVPEVAPAVVAPAVVAAPEAEIIPQPEATEELPSISEEPDPSPDVVLEIVAQPAEPTVVASPPAKAVDRRLSILVPPTLTLRPATPLVDSTSSLPLPIASIRILCLDGGGIRGLSVLLTLRSALAALSKSPNSPPPKPCDQFDLITGVGTGGLIAILLGRLRLSLDDAIDLYTCIADLAFRGKPNATRSRWSKLFGSSGAAAGRDLSLERALKAFLPEAPFLFQDPDGEDGEGIESPCLTAVLGYQQGGKGGGAARWLRSYEDDAEGDPGAVTVQQAARATLASTPFFRAYAVSPSVVYGASGSAQNPAEATLEEARRVFGPDVPVGCFLSLGVGKVSSAAGGGAKTSGGARQSKTRARSLRLVGELSAASSGAAERFHGRARKEGWEDQLLRYNVDLGSKLDPGVEEWTVAKELRREIDAWMSHSHALGSASRLWRGLGGERLGPESAHKKSSTRGLRTSISMNDLAGAVSYYHEGNSTSSLG